MQRMEKQLRTAAKKDEFDLTKDYRKEAQKIIARCTAKKGGRSFNIDAKDSSGMTALMISAAKPNQDGQTKSILVQLIEAGANLEAQDKSGKTAVGFATDAEQFSSIKILIAAGANANYCLFTSQPEKMKSTTELSNAGFEKALSIWLEWGLDINATDNRGWTLLMTASDYGDDPIVKTLINAGALLDIKGNEGKTALSIASEKGAGSEAVVETLKLAQDGGPAQAEEPTGPAEPAEPEEPEEPTSEGKKFDAAPAEPEEPTSGGKKFEAARSMKESLSQAETGPDCATITTDATDARDGGAESAGIKDIKAAKAKEVAAPTDATDTRDGGCECDACVASFAASGTKIEGCDCGGAGQCSSYCSACAGFCVKLEGIKDIKVAKAKEVAAPPDATDTSDGGCECDACVASFAASGTKIEGCGCGGAGQCSGYRTVPRALDLHVVLIKNKAFHRKLSPSKPGVLALFSTFNQRDGLIYMSCVFTVGTTVGTRYPSIRILR